MKKNEEKHNKHYWEKGRNGWTPSTTLDDLIEDGTVNEEEMDNKFCEPHINDVIKTQSSHSSDMWHKKRGKVEIPEGYKGYFHTPYPESEIGKDDRVPDYYKGKNGYQARFVVDNFDLSYNIGTAVTYLLRAYRKHDTPVDCIKKAIAHLEFELEKIRGEE
ncbi:hypothetical protein H8D85_02205 [bacterium]|nr:hypothetical protein [bacterium]